MTWSETKGTVVVVDDDPSVRKGLTRLLCSCGFTVETYGSAREYLASPRGYAGPACLVLDVRLPGLDGLDLQQHLLSQDYCIPIVFITGHADVPLTVQALKRGASDFLLKPFDDEDLLRAIREALGKDTEARASHEAVRDIMRRIDCLTPREHEVFRHVIAGTLNKQIGAALGIAEKTVKVHRARVMEKMGVLSVAELVRLAEKAQIQPAGMPS